MIERGSARLKRWPGVATRFEKWAVIVRAAVVVVAIVLWLAA